MLITERESYIDVDAVAVSYEGGGAKAEVSLGGALGLGGGAKAEVSLGGALGWGCGISGPAATYNIVIYNL